MTDPTVQFPLAEDSDDFYKPFVAALGRLTDEAADEEVIIGVEETVHSLVRQAFDVGRSEADALRTALRMLAAGATAAVAYEHAAANDSRPCPYRYCDLRDVPARHEWVLSFEDRGLEGFGDLLSYLFYGPDDPDDFPGEEANDCPRLALLEFGRFVHNHNWRRPHVVHDLANVIEVIQRDAWEKGAVCGSREGADRRG